MSVPFFYKFPGLLKTGRGYYSFDFCDWYDTVIFYSVKRYLINYPIRF